MADYISYTLNSIELNGIWECMRSPKKKFRFLGFSHSMALNVFL